jgi:hypothetical protein
MSNINKKGSVPVSEPLLSLDVSMDKSVSSSEKDEKSEAQVENYSPRKKCKIESVPVEEQKVGILRRMLQNKHLKIDSSISDKGFLLDLKWGSSERKFNVLFPEDTWKSIPESIKQTIISNVSLLVSLELGIMLKAKKISYNTPMPLFKSFFMEVLLKCLLYSGDCDSKKNIEYITRLCNLELSFKGNPVQANTELFSDIKEGCIHTMTFGKESLVSFGLCQELGLNPIPVTVIEPDCDVIYRNKHIKTFQNKHKFKLMKQFEEEFGMKVHQIDSNLNDITDYTLWDLDPTDLGWATQLTQYAFLLLPFNYFLNSKYIAYGNEYARDCYYYDDEGFKCHPTYDQTTEWMDHMNSMLHSLTGGCVQSISLVEPIQEIAVAKILYSRYPHLAKYQASCHGNNKGAEKNRWCGECHKCATCYIFMKALNFDPANVGMKDMLSMKHKKFYALFNEEKDLSEGFYSSPLGRDAQLLAFQMALKLGVEGELMDLFKQKFGEEAEAKEEELRNELFKVHRPENIPNSLWKKLKPIFEQELSSELPVKVHANVPIVTETTTQVENQPEQNLEVLEKINSSLNADKEQLELKHSKTIQ